MTRPGVVIAGAAVVALGFMIAQRWGAASAPVAASAAGESAHAPPPAIAVTPPPAPQSPGGDPPESDSPDHIALIVASTPPGASVLLAGALRGRTPCSIEVPRGEQPITVVVARDGFPPVAERVIPGTDQRLVVHLAPSASTPKPRARPKGAHHRSRMIRASPRCRWIARSARTAIRCAADRVSVDRRSGSR